MRKVFAILVSAAILLSLAAIPVLAQTPSNVELHGYMQNRLYANPDYSARFVTERGSLSAIGNFGDATGYIELYIHPWLTDRTFSGPLGGTVTADQFRIYLESAYADLPFANGRLRLGKGRQLNFGLTPSYPNRKTSQYGILAETFTQDRITGAQYSYKCGAFDFGASLFSDLQVETRSVGDFSGAINGPGAVSTVKHFVDKDDPANPSGALAGSVRIGVTRPNYQIHFSGQTGGLSQADADFIGSQYVLDGTYTAGDNTDVTHNQYGVDASYSYGPFVVQGEWYQGNFSFVKVTGYQVLVGYQPKDKGRFYARWSALNNNQSPFAQNIAGPPARQIGQPTWDTRQLTLAYIQPIRKGIWVELDYERNLENPPAGFGDKDNDLFFVELFTGF